tara:strand:+ start:713 stop:1606 length:894 start_codon:yes stop_codon:yes gene_type:complete
MPEITAVQYMTENLAIWLDNNQILKFSPAKTPTKYAHVQHFFSSPVDVLDVYRRGKNSIVITNRGTMILKYNLSGNVFRRDEIHSNDKFMRGFFTLGSGDYIIFSDKINLAHIDILEGVTDTSTIEHILSKKLGPEFWPHLSDGKSPDGNWWKNILIGKGKGKQLLYTAIKNQQKVAGIGNIIAIEALFRSKISPELRCCDLNDMQWSKLAQQIGIVVEHSLEQHRSLRLKEQSKISDSRCFSGILHLVSEGKHRAEGYVIYGRLNEICPECDEVHIKKTKVGCQPLYWCPNCQRTS